MELEHAAEALTNFQGQEEYCYVIGSGKVYFVRANSKLRAAPTSRSFHDCALTRHQQQVRPSRTPSSSCDTAYPCRLAR
jgi:hypothetical protein